MTLDDFAKYLGVSQPTVSSWLNGKRRPTGKNIDTIADLLGPEIYDLLGLQRPDPGLIYITRNWHHLSEDFKYQIQEEATKDLYEQGIINDRPPLPYTNS